MSTGIMGEASSVAKRLSVFKVDSIPGRLTFTIMQFYPEIAIQRLKTQK